MKDKYENRLRTALENIRNYVLPVYTINGQKYVKLEHAKALRKFAEEALKEAQK